MGKLIFITGGERSGKSSFAIELAQKSGKKVVFVATATPMDSEMRERIKNHRNSRPKSWETLEITGDLDKKIGQIKNKEIVIDCLTIYTYHLMKKFNQEEILEQAGETIKAIKKSKAEVVVVSNEVGCGIIPDNKMSRDYCDILGRVNQIFAQAADKFYVMFSGVPVDVKKL